MLRTHPGSESIEVIRRLGAGHSVETILKHAGYSGLLLQLIKCLEHGVRYGLPYKRRCRHYLYKGQSLPGVACLEAALLSNSLPQAQAFIEPLLGSV